MREAQNRFLESTVRNWISRFLRGPPADVIQSLGPYTSVVTILAKLETMHGAVAPLDVMMRKLFSLNQAKGESVTNYAIRLETTLANIQRDHPAEVTEINLDTSKRDQFYLGLKKSYKESLRYLYDTGAASESILKVARKAEVEEENYKDNDPAPAKSAQAQGVSTELMTELAAIKAVVNKAWSSQQKNQKQGKQEDSKKGGEGKTNKQQKKGPDPCHGFGGIGHFIKGCQNPKRKSLNSKGGTEEEGLPYQEEGSWDINRSRTNSGGRGQHSRGWARTGLEPEIVVCLNFIIYDAMIAHELCESLCLRLNPFKCDIPNCVGLDGVVMTKSITTILGWVQVELGIPFMGCIATRLWVAGTMHNHGVPLVLGSHVIKKIFTQANLEKINC